MEGAAELVAESESYRCITDRKQFKVVHLNKDILYTGYDEHKRRHFKFTTGNNAFYGLYIKILHIFHRSYRLATY